jgi:hypothetical protein
VAPLPGSAHGLDAELDALGEAPQPRFGLDSELAAPATYDGGYGLDSDLALPAPRVSRVLAAAAAAEARGGGGGGYGLDSELAPPVPRMSRRHPQPLDTRESLTATDTAGRGLAALQGPSPAYQQEQLPPVTVPTAGQGLGTLTSSGGNRGVASGGGGPASLGAAPPLAPLSPRGGLAPLGGGGGNGGAGGMGGGAGGGLASLEAPAGVSAAPAYAAPAGKGGYGLDAL